MPSDEARVPALVSEMKRALAKATTLEELTRVRDEAEAVRCLVQKAKLGLEIHNEVAEFKLRAERKAGEMLAAAARPGRKSTKKTYHDGTFKLGDLGITRNQSSRWQREAAVPEATFEAYLREARQAGKEVTAAELLRRAAVRSFQAGSRPRARAERRSGDAKEMCLRAAGPPVVRDDRSGATIETAREILGEAKSHHALLASILMPFCEQSQPIESAARRHAARLLRDLGLLLEQAERSVG